MLRALESGCADRVDIVGGERMNERRILFVRGQVPRAARARGVVAEKAKLGRLGEKGEELGDGGGSSGWEGVGGERSAPQEATHSVGTDRRREQPWIIPISDSAVKIRFSGTDGSTKADQHFS